MVIKIGHFSNRIIAALLASYLATHTIIFILLFVFQAKQHTGRATQLQQKTYCVENHSYIGLQMYPDGQSKGVKN